MSELFAQLQQSQARTIVFSKDIDSAVRRRHSHANIRFESESLDMKLVSSECDWAILNGGHGTVASMLLAGKPCLMFPLYVEQFLNACAIHNLGAGLAISPQAIAHVRPALLEMISKLQYAERARAFASSYPNFTPGKQIPKLVDRLEWLIVTHKSGN